MGAWIEIGHYGTGVIVHRASLPSWERGLKWKVLTLTNSKSYVAPLVGAWIEIEFTQVAVLVRASLPSWERGLKSFIDGCCLNVVYCRSPRGSVD